MSYYYLTASLPMLSFGEPPPYTAEEFILHCEGALDAGDLHELTRVIAAPFDRASTAAGRAWQSAETQLRSTVALHRASRLGVDGSAFARDYAGFEMRIAAAVEEAFAKATPLKKEETLDRCRWALADDIAIVDPYGFPAVVAHAVQLKLATRWANMKNSSGRDRVEGFVHDAVELNFET